LGFFQKQVEIGKHSGQFNKLSYIICLSSDIIHFAVCSLRESLTSSKNPFIESHEVDQKFLQAIPSSTASIRLITSSKNIYLITSSKTALSKAKSIKMIECQLVVKTTYGI
jgi:hypothetical protein